MYPLKILFINRFTKNKMHTAPLHASNPQLRGILAQGHRSRSRSLQKSRKTVYPLKFLFINRFTKNKMHTVPLNARKPQLRGIFAQGHRSSSRSLQKSRKTVYPLKILFINRFSTELQCSVTGRADPWAHGPGWPWAWDGPTIWRYQRFPDGHGLINLKSFG